MRPELTKRADYAIRAMLALTRTNDNRPLSTRRIAEEMEIPVRFLPQAMGDLSRAGLVRAESGRNGGYLLQRPAVEISLLDVIEAVEGDSRRQSCVLRGGPCGRSGPCDVHEVFVAAQDALLGTLSATSLASVASVVGPGAGGGWTGSGEGAGPAAWFAGNDEDRPAE